MQVGIYELGGNAVILEPGSTSWTLEHREGAVMDTVLTYAMDQAYTSSRRTLLSEFRSSEQVRHLIDRGDGGPRHIGSERPPADAHRHPDVVGPHANRGGIANVMG